MSTSHIAPHHTPTEADPNARPNSSSSSSSSTSHHGSLTTDYRKDRSLFMHALQAGMKPLRPRATAPSKSVDQHGSPRLKPHKKALDRCHVEERQVEGVWMYDMTRKPADSKECETKTDDTTRTTASETQPEAPKRIFYFAGGSWQMYPSRDHWAFCAEIARRLPNTVVSLVSPPLAPRSPAHTAMPQLKTWYHIVMRQATEIGERVILAGDSSGGNIALCLTLWALNEPEEHGDRPALTPSAVMAICATTDLRHEDPGIQEAAKKDPIMTAASIMASSRAWCYGITDDKELAPSSTNPQQKHQDDTSTSTSTAAAGPWWHPDDPKISPVLADLALLARHNVRVDGVIGTQDVLAPEAAKFRDRCGEAGVRGRWLQWDGQMHCFPLAFSYGLRESAEGIDWVAEVLREA